MLRVNFLCSLKGTSVFLTRTPSLPFLYCIFVLFSYFTIKFYYYLCIFGVCASAGCLGPATQGSVKKVTLGGSHLNLQGMWAEGAQYPGSGSRTKAGDWVSLQAA